MGKRGIVATVKTDEERGHPAAAWAYHARDKLRLSDREVVERLGKYDEATIRKAESHSRNLSRPLWRALVPMYQQVAADRGVVLPVPPAFHEERSGRSDTPDLAALIAALTAQATANASLAQTITRNEDRIVALQREVADLTETVAGLVDRIAALEEGGAPPSEPLPGPSGGRQGRGDPNKTHAGAR